MKRNRILPTAALLLGAAVFPGVGTQAADQAVAASPQKPSYLSPTALAVTSDGKTLFIANATANQVAFFDTASAKTTRTVSVPEAPSGLALTADGKSLYVTCAAPESTICIVDTVKGSVTDRLRGGYQAQSPVLSPDERTLYVCNRFNNDVSIFDLATMKEVRRIGVPREPFSAAVTPDGKHLLVANHIHAGRADGDVVASSVSVIDLAAGKVLKEIVLPNGSTLLRDLRVSPDGRYAVVAHILARFHLPTTQIERGWINSNAGSIIDLAEMKLLNTVLFDNIDSGAATPWAVAWSRDGRQLLVTHAGTHELSVVDFPALLAKLAKVPVTLDPGKPVDYTAASRTAAEVPNDLSFLVGVRQRLKLPGKGPRSLAVAGSRAWVANYFSDTLNAVDVGAPASLPAGSSLGDTPARMPALPDRLHTESFALGPAPQMTTARLGEFYFNDATICFQGWQACSSCHSHDARVDGLNWDNLNDGIGNPKNGKSLLQSFETPPEMWLGVRSNAHLAVRMGIRNSLFTVQPPEVAEALDDYLKSLQPMPSPRLVKGKLSASAQRGKKVFQNEKLACAECHSGPHYTDMKFHDVGSVGKFDQPTDQFDTPSLIEVWRSGPYLHDGRAATIRDMLKMLQRDGKHGDTSQLPPRQLDDLVEYVLSQ